MSDEAVCTEVSVSASVGGKLQIVKFEYSADYHYSMSQKYTVPEDWSEEQIKDFQTIQTIELRANVEEIADAELKSLMDQRDGIKS